MPPGWSMVPYGDPVRPHSRYAWMLALNPLAFLVFEGILGGTQLSSSTYRPVVLAVLIVLNSVLISADARALGSGGIRLGGLARFALLVPLYLLLRVMRGKQQHALLLVWVLAFILALPNTGVLAHTVGGRVKGQVVERFITTSLQGRMSTRSVSVDCPNHPRVRPGHSFQCPVRYQALDAVVDVTMRRDGTFTWTFLIRGLDGRGSPVPGLAG